jgi:hypothetical protein
MKPLFIFIFLITGICYPLITFSQTTNYSYEYDQSGNRVSRNVIYLRSAKIRKDSLSEYSLKEKTGDVFRETINNTRISIYPNPTKGLVNVNIQLSVSDIARIKLYDIQGKLLMDNNNPGTMTEVDLSGLPSGIYLMQIFVNNKPATWKIIKQD